MGASNVGALEFRVYRVNDPVKFFQQLDDPHQFGGGARPPSQKLTLLDLLHFWKRGLRTGIRLALRHQFTEPPSAHFETLFAHRAAPGERGARFAEAPLLNPQQLVLTFVQPLRSSSRWDSETVPVGIRQKGLYLVEAVLGTLRWQCMLPQKSQDYAIAVGIPNGAPICGWEHANERPVIDSFTWQGNRSPAPVLLASSSARSVNGFSADPGGSRPWRAKSDASTAIGRRVRYSSGRAAPRGPPGSFSSRAIPSAPAPSNTATAVRRSISFASNA